MGVLQAKSLAARVKTLEPAPEVVVVSPLRRAVRTAAYGFRSREALAAGAAPPFVATELCRERISFHTCDARRPLSMVQAEFGDFVDLSEMGTSVSFIYFFCLSSLSPVEAGVMVSTYVVHGHGFNPQFVSRCRQAMTRLTTCG